MEIHESEGWYEVLDSEGYIVAQFLDHEEACWYINNKPDFDN